MIGESMNNHTIFARAKLSRCERRALQRQAAQELRRNKQEARIIAKRLATTSGDATRAQALFFQKVELDGCTPRLVATFATTPSAFYGFTERGEAVALQNTLSHWQKTPDWQIEDWLYRAKQHLAG